MRQFTIKARLFAVAALVAALFFGAPAVADQSDCRNLEASLASVSNGGDRTKLRRYERAIISQKQQLERAQNRQKNTGCSSFLSGIKPHCNDIRATVSRMERNLLDLQRTKNELAGGDSAREKTRILAALHDNGCRGTTASVNDKDKPTGLFARLFGNDENPRTERRNPIEPEAVTGNRIRMSVPGRTVPPGNYRTLCVRTCDGYFFPIAYLSSPALFDRDTKACEAMCPGTEVELYFHRVPGEETDAMISSASGEPYTGLSAAFKYREPGYQRAKACQCNPPKDFSIIAGDLPEQTEEDVRSVEQVAVLPEPEWRPDPAEDPETRANREGGLTASAMAELLAPKLATKEKSEPVAVQAAEDGERRIRVVGPTFLPDPEGAIDLRAPGRTELR
ncbi:MAG: DUF2865 domain-containing protein [Rhizobiaceae bacterium]